MSNYRDIIKAPIITEKSAALAETNTYVFSVDVRANKTQIKQAIENIFDINFSLFIAFKFPYTYNLYYFLLVIL